jgi:cytoskeleton protein RodZ
MSTEIGTTLRETRMRRRIDLGEVEAATKIRARYLRALENEEWDVLPGGAYTRSFIRTYANHLGLDGERLADQFRRAVEEESAVDRLQRPEGPTPGPAPVGAPSGSRLQVSRGALAVLISLGLIVLLIGIGLAGGGGDGGDGGASPATGKQRKGQGKGDNAQPAPTRVSLRLSAAADVWVCLLDAKQSPLIDGQILAAGAEEGPFRSAGFTVSFGNGAVEMQVNGKQVSVEDTPNPVGYEIARGGQVRPLSESTRPTCT